MSHKKAQKAHKRLYEYSPTQFLIFCFVLLCLFVAKNYADTTVGY